MYVPPRYRVTDDAVIDALLRDNGFMTIVTAGAGGLMASHVPVELVRDADGGRLLRGHLAKANAQWKELQGGVTEALVICLGPHTYITPTWYDHPNVPTWNYIAVHASGPASIEEHPDELLGQVRDLSRHYEPPGGPEPRFDVDAMPPQLRAAELKGIVGFEVRVLRIEAAFKLSQNRHSEDYARIMSALEARGDDQSRAVANAMRTVRTLND